MAVRGGRGGGGMALTSRPCALRCARRVAGPSSPATRARKEGASRVSGARKEGHASAGWGEAVAFGEKGGAEGVGVLEDFVVPEADDLEAEGFEVGGAGGVAGGGLGMLAAVEFDDELEVGAEEVGDVGAERDLALPAVAAEASIAEAGPEFALGGGLVAAETAGASDLFPDHGGTIIFAPSGEKPSPTAPERSGGPSGR